MLPLAQQRCLHHAHREAVARCPECTLFFCRECVTEHDDRVVCAGCLRRLGSGESARTGRMAALSRALQFAAALLLLWTAFYATGRLLLTLPSDFHDGALWQSSVLDEESP